MTTSTATSQPPFTSLSQLQNTRILILGGTSGMGFAIASASLAHGARVTISSSSPAKVSSAMTRLRNTAPSPLAPTKDHDISGQACDLSQPDRIEDNLRALFESIGEKVNHVAFTAGDALTIKPIHEATVDYIQRAGTVRFLGGLMLGKLAPQYLVPGPQSSITLTGGSNSTKPSPNWTVMAAWGQGIEGIMRGLAVDLAPIRVNLIKPGAVHTELFADIPAERLEKVLERMRKGTLTGTVGRPEEVAEMYLGLMKCAFATGSVVDVDGGRLLV